jgi:branched-chain amino acid transport system permease protein
MRFAYDTSYRDAQRVLRYPSDRLSYGLLVVALISAPWMLSAYYVGELSYLFIACIASLGLMVLTGYTGQVSLGHAAFVAIGAYAHTWFLNHDWGFLASILSAAALTGAVGLVIGLPAIRVSGLYLAMVTLAGALLTEQFIGRWKDVTGGYSGVSVPAPIIFGVDFGSLRAFYFLCLFVLAVVLFGLFNLMRGRTGRAFVGIRDSEAAAYTLGIWVGGYKVFAFVISATVTGIAGALLAHHLQFLTPDGFGLTLSMELVLMVVIGGLGSLRGAIFGAVLIGLLPSLISKIKPALPAALSAQFGLETFVFGLILAAFVMFEPNGLNGRWIKLKALLETFPLYRRSTFRRGKAYMHSERYR